MGLMFGRFDHQMDEKNRIRIPKRLRDAFPADEPLFYYMYQAHRVAVMPISVLDERTAHWDDHYGDDDYNNAVSASSGEIFCLDEDNQGRTQIPKVIRDDLHLTKNITFVGKRNYIEIWDTDYYDTFIASLSIKEKQTLFENRGTSSR